MNYIIKVAKAQKGTWISTFWAVTGTCVFSVAFLTGIMLIAKPDSFLNISAAIIPIVLLITLFAISFWEIIHGFGVAVKFSITRKGFIFSTLATYAVMTAVMLGYAYLLSKVDYVIGSVFWANTPMGEDIVNGFYMIFVSVAAYVAVALGFIVGYLVLKYGKNVLWVIWGTYMLIVLFVLPRIDEISDLGIDLKMIGIGGAVVLVAGLVATVFALLRQEISI